MAWMDDRAWCHPKFTDLGDRAFRVYWNGVAYCSGMGTGGVLSSAQQQLVGATPKVRRELVDAGLWDVSGGDVQVHDWDDHNGRRDARKEADRLRKRAARAAERADRPADSPADSPVERRQDRRALKVVKEVNTPKAPTDAPGPLTRPERSVATAMTARCPDCHATYGEGHTVDCPRMPAVVA